MSKIVELEQAILALEGQRSILGDAVVDAALSSMRAELTRLAGQPTEREHQRKLLTVLFMDMVGSTRISQGLDPEEMLEIMDGALQALAAPVKKYRGRVTRYMGDGFKAIFGLPQAYEDDAERAVLAGLEILQVAQELAARLQEERRLPGFAVRVGINTGMVAAGGNSEADATIMGLTVNLAARMEQAASPGSLLISHHTYRHVQRAFEVQPVAPVSAKGFAQPVPAYLVLRAKEDLFTLPARGVYGQEIRLIGRQNELQQLKMLFERVQRGTKAQFVTLVSEPGLGKSRLLYEFGCWLDAHAEEVFVFKGRAVHHLTGMPYSLLRSIFIERFQIRDHDPVEISRRKIETGLAGYLLNEPAMKSHFIGALLGFEFSDSPYLEGVRGDSQQLRQRALLYLQEFLCTLSRQKMVVIFLEDIQHADPPSLEAVIWLASRCPDTRLLAIALARPELYTNQPDWDTRLEENVAYARLDLGPLTPAQCQELAREVLAQVMDLPEKLVAMLAGASEGNPYYLDELVRVLIDDGVIQTPDGQQDWLVDVEKLERLRTPPTLTALLQARLDRLSRAQKSTLQQAAVVGRIFWDAALQHLQGGTHPPEDLLAALSQREWILPDPKALPGGLREYSFKSALMHEVVYEMVPIRERAAYHAAAGDWLAAEMSHAGRADEYAAAIAHHYAHAGDHNQGNSRSLAADWFTRAGERALNQGAPAEARRFFDLAIDYLPPEESECRWRALLGRNEVLGVLGDTRARQADNQALIELAQSKQDDDWLAEAFYRQGFHLANTGAERQAIQSYDLALEAARRSQNLRVVAQVLALKVVALTRTGELSAAGTSAQAALAAIRNFDDLPTHARVLTNLALHFSETGDISRAVLLFHQAHEIADQLDERIGKATILANLGYNYLLLGQFSEGRTTLEQSLQAAESIEARHIAAFARLNLGLACTLNSETQPARKVLHEALDELGQIGDSFGVGAGHIYLGLSLEQEDDYQSAEDHFLEARQIFAQAGLHGYGLDALAGLARCSLARQEMQEAYVRASQLWSALQARGTEGMEFPILAYLSCAQAYLAAGEGEISRQIYAVGRVELRARAEKISDPAWREIYLSALPEHRQLIEQENSFLYS